MKFNVTIKGIAPLLQHRFSEDVLTTVKKKSAGVAHTADSKKEQAEKFLYTHQGKLSQPSSHIEGAMLKAAPTFKLGGSGKKSYKDLIKGACFVFPEMIPHKSQKWEVDARAIVNSTTKGRAMCYRPRLETWELSFSMEVNDDRANPEVIEQMLKHAGLYVGIGAYRPRFGRFEITSFKQTE